MDIGRIDKIRVWWYGGLAMACLKVEAWSDLWGGGLCRRRVMDLIGDGSECRNGAGGCNLEGDICKPHAPESCREE